MSIKLRNILLLVLLLVVLTACIPGNVKYITRPAGFLTGVWHGWIAPLSLIISIFKSNINIYEINNVGFWYDLGFYAAIVSGFGGLSFSRSKRKHNKKR